VRATAAEKLETIRLVEGSELSVTRTLEELGVARSTFYRWYRTYLDEGAMGLETKPASRRRFWNRIPEAERERVVEAALAEPELSPRQLAWRITDREGVFVSESSVYRILKAYDLVTSPAFVLISAKDRFDHPTRRVHELWQTDFTYFKVVGWGWYYLLTVLDDYSRYIVDWKLFTGMSAQDVQELLDGAIAKTGIEKVEVRHRPRLLSDNGPCFISKDLRKYLQDRGLGHTRGRPHHPQTQGKIERYHRTMKNVVKLQNYYVPWELEREIGAFVQHYNHERVHEALENLTPADVYLGRGRDILTARERLKRQTLRRRRRINRGLPVTPEERILPALYRNDVSLTLSTESSHFG
jgi:transposase InsO family protein